MRSNNNLGNFLSSMPQRRVVLAGLGMLLTTGSSMAQADVYPLKPIKLIATIPPGSTTDSMLRYLAERMGTILRQPVILDSRPGASGIVGTRGIATAPPDGYTIGMTSNGTLPAAPSLFKNLGYDINKGFTHIGIFSYLPYTLVVQKDLPAANLKEFLVYARTNPGKLSTGFYANSLRMAASDLKRAAKLDIVEVPYKSSTQILTDLKLGLIQFAFVPLSVAKIGQQADFLRIIGVTTEKRWDLLKEVPAISEELSGYSNVAWTALSAPAGTPPEVIRKLKSVLDHVLTLPETRERWNGFGAELVMGDGEDVQKLVTRDTLLWANFAKEANITPE